MPVRTYVVAVLVVGWMWSSGVYPPVHAQSAEEDADEEAASVWVNPRPYPANFWGPRTGIGLGAGLSVHNLGRDGSRGLVTALVGRYQQVGTVAWTPQWSHRKPGFTVLEGRAFHTKRDWFYGVGPFPHDDTRLELHRTQLRGGVRGRYLPFGTDALRLHAQVHVVHDRLYDQQNDDDDAFRQLDARSQLYLQAFGRTRTGDVRTRSLTGVRPQLGLSYDTRDREHGPRRGLLVHGQTGRYLDVEGGASFWTHEADLAGHVPLAAAHTIDLTAHARIARSTTDQPIPPMYLSALDAFRMPGVARGRFADRDRVLLGARYRVLWRNLANMVTVEPYVGGHAGAVYTDVFEQGTLDATIERTPRPTTNVPLRLSAHVGLRIAPRFRDSTWIDMAVGLGPDGVTGVRLAFTPTFHHRRPDHHNDRW
ncbi:MAG: hypothetical protein R6U20_03445 [Longimonas sp.]|uniref:hypothetical protein n=1 Tax=Longimonas sp. TaxID=2039626 RepID=UPI003974F3A0